MQLILILIAAMGAQACQREISFKGHLHRRHISRQNVPFPPVLDQNEQILVNSFNTSTIDTWSYYYTHGGKEKLTRANFCY